MRDGGALPGWPRFLRRELAARYVSFSVTTWDAEVAADRAPKPFHLTPGIKGWDRFDLDAWIEERKLAQSSAPNPWDGEPA